MNKFNITIALGLVALAGCKPTEKLGAELMKITNSSAPEMVIDSPFDASINGQVIRVNSLNECEDKNDKEHRKYKCIQLSKSTVDVQLEMPNGVKVETWTIEHKDDRVMLKRPDGSYVASAK